MFRKVFLLVLALMALNVFPAAAQEDAQQVEVLRFEVAEDGNRFVFDEAPVYEDGMPNYGASFVTSGYIYPEGTLDGTNGVLADGSPEFPDLVIGEWICMGYMIGDGAYTESGPWVISQQFYNFGEEYGNKTLVTAGYEIVDAGLPIQRAVSGGTGPYREARGEAFQTLLGFNETEGVVVSFEIELTDVIAEDDTVAAN